MLGSLKSLVIPKSVPISVLNDYTQHLIIKKKREYAICIIRMNMWGETGLR